MSREGKRRKLSLADKVVILTRQALCGLCQRPLGEGPVEWDHIVALGLGGADEASNLHAVHGGRGRCHDIKTNGPATKSFAQGDKAAIAKTKRLRKVTKAHRHVLAGLAEEEAFAEAEKPARGRRQWPAGRKIESRGFERRVK